MYKVNDFEFTEQMINVSGLFKEMFYESDEKYVSGVCVSDEYMKKIVEYLRYYTETEKMKEISRPVDSGNFKNSVPQEFYYNFIDIPESEITELCKAANYLDIKPLLYLCCAKIGFNIKNSTKEELINRFFNDKKEEVCDFTEQELINKHFGINDKLTDEELKILETHDKWTEPIY